VIAPQVIDSLRYVRVRNPKLSLKQFPSFFIVGPQRTGTTWLHANLRWHPEIFMADPKEIFFFNRLKDPSHPKFESADLDWYLDFFTATPKRYMVEQVMAISQCHSFYRARARGEATASYAAMDEDLIAELATLNPYARIVMMARDPVERAWSHAKKDLARNRGRRVDEVSDEQWRDFFSNPYQLQCARYSENLARWRRHFPANQVLALSYDDVTKRPESLLLQAMRFLGVASNPRFIGKRARQTVNPTPAAPMPAKHRAFIEDILAEPLREWREQWCDQNQDDI